MLVPQEDYLELAQILANRAETRGESPSLPDVTTDPTGKIGIVPAKDVASTTLAALKPWEADDLRRLAKSEFITAVRWARAIDVCCDHVEEFLSTQQIAKETGMSVNEWRDAPRKITRHLKARYPNVPAWPLAVKDGRALGHNDGQVYWAINGEQAARWQLVRGEAR